MAPMRQSIVATMTKAATMEATANRTVCRNSTTTSVKARAAVTSFWAMRPAKSLSKNVVEWPSVQRCNRVITSLRKLGPMTTLCM